MIAAQSTLVNTIFYSLLINANFKLKLATKYGTNFHGSLEFFDRIRLISISQKRHSKSCLTKYSNRAIILGHSDWEFDDS